MTVFNGRVGCILASVLLLFASAAAAPKAAAAFKNVQEGTQAPAFRLADVSGKEVSLESYGKDRALLIVFFAVWSGRSLEELKDVQKLMAALEPMGLRAIAVNVEHEHMTEHDMKAVRDKAAELKLTYPVLFDRGLETFRDYGVVSVPSTAILGEGSVVRSAFNGYPSSAYFDMKGQVEAMLGMKKADESQADARKDEVHWPNRQALLNYNLGRRLHRSGMSDKAEAMLRISAKADPAWAAPRALLGEIYLAKAKKDPGMAGEARKEFEAAVAAENGNAVARTGLARACWRAGAAADAEREVGIALKLSPSYPPALLLSASVASRKGDITEAERLMRLALDLAPMDAETHAMAGGVFEGAGELEKAARMYKKAWELGGE